MSVIRLTATAGPDSVLHLSVPVGAAGEYEVTVAFAPKPAEELGWPPGFPERTFGSIDDETFVAPPRDSIKPIPPLDQE
jgi:hypothetical protein